MKPILTENELLQNLALKGDPLACYTILYPHLWKIYSNERLKGTPYKDALQNSIQEASQWYSSIKTSKQAVTLASFREIEPTENSGQPDQQIEKIISQAERQFWEKTLQLAFQREQTKYSHRERKKLLPKFLHTNSPTFPLIITITAALIFSFLLYGILSITKSTITLSLSTPNTIYAISIPFPNGSNETVQAVKADTIAATQALTRDTLKSDSLPRDTSSTSTNSQNVTTSSISKSNSQKESNQTKQKSTSLTSDQKTTGTSATTTVSETVTKPVVRKKATPPPTPDTPSVNVETISPASEPITPSTPTYETP